jgi:murein DD-endopeptidase MepM/ murein hydrolase activator NlpD
VRLLSWIAVCGLATGCGSTGAQPARLTVELHARALAPGEPVRLVVSSTRPLRSLAGEFLGEPVHLVRTGSGDGGESWSGWAMIGLDQPPGLATLDLRGTDEKGGLTEGTRAVTIEAREFPVEQLTVAPRYVEPPPEVQQRLAREREKTARVYRTRRDVHPARQAFLRPVPGEPTSVFGTRRLFNGQPRSPHSGLDLRAAEGTPVHASGDGLVALAEELYFSGNVVILDHGGGLFTIYAHLSEIRVSEGQQVASGELLGLSGATGRVNGPHLHWGAKVGRRPFNPAALLDPALFELAR